MKKRILAILIAVLCISLVFAFTSCGGNDNTGDNTNSNTNENTQTECAEHTFGEWTTVTDASCTEAGSEKRVCSVCSEEETREIPAGHNWKNWETTTPAECETAGEQTRECRDCDATETEAIKATGHEKQITTEAKAPTATENGSTEGAKCANCDYIYSEAVELSKLGNLANADNLTLVQGESWHSFEGPKSYLFDGDDKTAPHSPKGSPYVFSIELKKDSYIHEVTVVCNGSGTLYNAWNSSKIDKVTYNIKRVAITCYKDGEIVDSKNFEDTTKLTTVKLEGVNAYVDTIEIYVESAIQNNGGAYIWEINAYGTAPITECDKTGSHTFGDWVVTKEPICTDADTFEDGEETQTCSVCGKEEKRTIKAEHNFTESGKYPDGSDFIITEPACGQDGEAGSICLNCGKTITEVIPMLQDHVWGEWNTEGLNCVDGGTKTRECTNDGCDAVDSEVVPAGEHANIVVDGRVEPTFEADGNTGNAVCTVCHTIISNGETISKLVNEAYDATISTDGGWSLTGPDWDAPDTRPYLNDGDMTTGITAVTSTRDTTHTLTWESSVAVDTVKLYFSGDGTGKTVGYNSGFLSNTNPDTTITVTIYGADSTTTIKTVTIYTKDLTEYKIDLGEVTEISMITISVYTGWDGAKSVNIWECQAYVDYVM